MVTQAIYGISFFRALRFYDLDTFTCAMSSTLSFNVCMYVLTLMSKYLFPSRVSHSEYHRYSTEFPMGMPSCRTFVSTYTGVSGDRVFHQSAIRTATLPRYIC
jgi:hypothetical protein